MKEGCAKKLQICDRVKTDNTKVALTEGFSTAIAASSTIYNILKQPDKMLSFITHANATKHTVK